MMLFLRLFILNLKLVYLRSLKAEVGDVFVQFMSSLVYLKVLGQNKPLP